MYTTHHTESYVAIFSHVVLLWQHEMLQEWYINIRMVDDEQIIDYNRCSSGRASGRSDEFVLVIPFGGHKEVNMLRL
jgi:hypothetical protein